jgi:NitT/TauT family transport system permease protein
MMSFGGGWFFLAASEAITVLNNNFLLPGIGSYMAVAVEKRNVNAELWAIVTMVIIVLLVDQLFWRPIVAWSQKFKFEQTDSSDEPTSVVLDIIRQSKALPWLSKRIGAPTARGLNRIFGTASKIAESGGHVTYITRRAFSIAMGLAAVVGICYWLFRGFEVVRSGVTISMLEEVFRLTCFTLLRVISMVVFATIVWTPIGVAIGFSPKLSRIAQPLVQIGASFPANLLFPLVVLAFQYFHIGLNWGSVILIALGTQWYILFNVIAGASSVPSDLREAATVFRLTRWNLWRTLILPAIFPAWVTGALTAAGGAWNASIVAEIAQTGPNSFLHAEGIGNYIAVQTTGGNWPGIITGIGMMSLFVVILNKLVWRRLYTVGETRFGLG